MKISILRVLDQSIYRICATFTYTLAVRKNVKLGNRAISRGEKVVDEYLCRYETDKKIVKFSRNPIRNILYFFDTYMKEQRILKNAGLLK